ncbi:hypothetical protein TNIN_414661 [Trichonephila inaurata madagascariensis]|uniref:Uncharacterized protein n=1 Tax=Trichonephila inaurata madagascariensis TaxID=2747483 RepID=A0A8X6M9Q8_9ARAC|nr:hypothetical protein TNIN_414661 [Trichonephila inaurata madagascariensis]
MWEEIVSRKISCLSVLPKNLEIELRSFIHLICLEIDEWQQDHKNCPFPSEVLQRDFCWNPQGKIDRTKTARALIKTGFPVNLCLVANELTEVFKTSIKVVPKHTGFFSFRNT